MKKQFGFTLVELLIVLGVIGVLATVILVAINPLKKFAQARDTRRRSDIAIIVRMLEQYNVLRDHYPAEGKCDSSIGFTPDVGLQCKNLTSAGDDWSILSPIRRDAVKTDKLLTRLPKDPINNLQYYYCYEPTSWHNQGTWCEGPAGGDLYVCRYWIGAKLEVPEDINKPIFRCTDDEVMYAANGVGCKAVSILEQSGCFKLP